MMSARFPAGHAGLPEEGPEDPLDTVDAPVDIRFEVEVEAGPVRVWQTLSDVSRWPLWNRGVSFAVLEGELAPGTRLHWRADGMRIASQIAELESQRLLGLTLRTMGGRGYHRWTLEPLEGDRVLVRSEEVWDGLGVRILRRTLRRTLTRSRIHWLEALKNQVEGSGGRDV
jgi:hypothetical protein